MRQKYLILLFLIYLAAAINAQKNVLFQYATFNSLSAGLYDGELQISELLKRGNLGLGTFNGLNGELIILDNSCYQSTTDTLHQIEVINEEKTPFAVCTNFQESLLHNFQQIDKHDLDSIFLKKIHSNSLVALKVEGKFSRIRFRTAVKQKTPYRLLSIAIKDQKVFEKYNLSGTLVGFYFPSFMNGINVEGFHWHFISSDKKWGGHVLDYKAESISVAWSIQEKFELQLPTNEAFQKSVYKVSEAETELIEKGK